MHIASAQHTLKKSGAKTAWRTRETSTSRQKTVNKERDPYRGDHKKNRVQPCRGQTTKNPKKKPSRVNRSVERGGGPRPELPGGQGQRTGRNRVLAGERRTASWATKEKPEADHDSRERCGTPTKDVKKKSEKPGAGGRNGKARHKKRLKVSLPTTGQDKKKKPKGRKARERGQNKLTREYPELGRKKNPGWGAGRVKHEPPHPFEKG